MPSIQKLAAGLGLGLALFFGSVSPAAAGNPPPPPAYSITGNGSPGNPYVLNTWSSGTVGTGTATTVTCPANSAAEQALSSGDQTTLSNAFSADPTFGSDCSSQLAGSSTVSGGVSASGSSYSGPTSAPIDKRSVGGKGGDGDFITLLVYSWGTNGGGGGGAGAVTVDTSGSAHTTAGGAPDITALSIGGDGGGGGGAGAAIASEAGSGGNGGAGGPVSVMSSATLTTSGAGSAGIVGFSAGGNGGPGGSSVATGYGSGGGGGSGGPAGTVDITNTGSITTTNDNSPGIYARSLGGRGGNGGSSYLSFGGSGGSGGNTGVGNTVTVSNIGVITTSGVNSAGIFAQSVGGFAGAGGSSDIGVVGFGGVGGSGGDGGEVHVTNYGSGTITTYGPSSSGIFAQSVGGGGGAGGSGIGLITIAGSGSLGGIGKTVTVTNYGAINAHGDQSSGIYAQSVGGGGGSGGGGAGVIGIGGVGASGSTGGSVTVVNTGTIRTYGHGDYVSGATSQSTLETGIYAQSVGGAGGDGGSSVGLVSIGGSGGAGNDSGTVTVNNSGNITSNCTVNCQYSTAIYAQSVGGGGGNGGGALAAAFEMGGSGGSGGVGGAVEVQNTGNLTATGMGSNGIFAQSVGGGGGNGGFAVGVGAFGNLAIGGSGAGGGRSSNVCINDDGSCGAIRSALTASTITTSGDNSAGIFAQSIGGGGGNGGFAVAASGGLFSVSVALGGQGGPGGAGESVFVGSSGSIVTTGAKSDGIQAESVGGGGGNGGFSVALSGGWIGAASFSLGGLGGAGNTGGAVTVDSFTSIMTGGAQSNGIYAESVGGGGGDGGFAVSGSGAAGGAISVGLGGGGGTGGNSGAVLVNSTGAISTGADQANGIFAQSAGGGGGNGGFAIGAAGAGAASAAVTLGGGGGNGGTGATVTVNSHGQITTTGLQSDGIFAQSVGGGGGNGGFAVSAAGAAFGEVTVALGGKGANGGNSDAVSVTSVGAITTQKALSDGIFAQSVGGGGGNGGFAVSAGGAMGGAVNLGFGGGSGNGGAGSTVYVNSTGQLQTSGNFADGIEAQSVGGGGGNGGFSVAASGAQYGAVALAFGGAGGDGGGVLSAADHGSNPSANWIGTTMATVVSVGDISTQGVGANGIFAQSAGGGGGNGGFAVAASGAQFASAALSFGGTGANGGNAGGVSINSNGMVSTQQSLSNGIFGQSVGGSGGNGGFSVAVAGAQFGAISLGFGGQGGSGGDAGNVAITSSGDGIMTRGNSANGIFAQSVGGGGGNGGFSVAATGAQYVAVALSFGGQAGTGGNSMGASVNSTESIQTGGNYSNGIFAQSVGGGGGNGGFSIGAAGAQYGAAAITFGGAAADGGSAGAASVTSKGSIWTSGFLANGIEAQSLGGGGGNGGFSVSVAGSEYAAGSLAFGGSGANGGSASSALVGSTGDIHTIGVQSDGILAQSIGGGGGNGGFAISGSLTISADSLAGSIAVGGAGGAGATAGKVDVTSVGDISTQSASALGIQAQSIGGGGGNGGWSGALTLSQGVALGVSIGGGGGTGNTAGDVSVTSTGNVTTAGANAIGIQGQSIGGAGGDGGFSLSLAASLKNATVGVSLAGSGATGGVAGKVDVTSNGTVYTTGAMAVGIEAQSIGGAGGNGGFAVAASASNGDYGSVAVGIGGGAGSGNTAGDVTVNANATAHSLFTGYTVFTSGDGSTGILAQSIGGNGGNGGFAIAGALTTQKDAQATTDSIGGAGGAGGQAGDVTVTNKGDIGTVGMNAGGILAQSLGGGGGNGGWSVAAGVALGESDSANASTGGAGNGGGTAKTATVANTGDISTSGALSAAIEAQSVGGSGGNGGWAVGAGFSLKGGVDNSTTGGDGGSGGVAGAVQVTSSGTIATTGDKSDGIVAQSIGGNGGTGGFAAALSLALGDKDNAASDAEGGKGVSGGVAGTVTVGTTLNPITGQITTTGLESVGILAQSIGGSGGAGGFAVSGALSAATASASAQGGEGGTGDTANSVTVNNGAKIGTSGSMSQGILAQSIGGGGGSGGFAVSLGAGKGGSTTSDPGLSLGSSDGGASVNTTNYMKNTGVQSNATGGSGGTGADAGAVTVSNTALVMTTGASSDAIQAQSIGGGGGNGGFAGAISLASESEAVANSIGGAGGEAGKGGTVQVTNAGVIVTTGDQSSGVFAQSIGGGGGNGGFSIGAAGGNKASAESTTVGGGGGVGGSADAVTVTNTASGQIMTQGSMAYGVYAQSVGGGGGNGGFSVAAAISLQGDSDSKVGGSATGGGGGAAGDGANVKVTNYGSILTKGAGADAVIAQSIGGGGGTAGFAAAATIGLGDAATTNNAVGGSGGAAGAGKLVQVYNYGSIQTVSDQATGILAQSIGGGGGDGAFSVGLGLSKAGATNTNVGGGGGAAGAAGEVDVSNYAGATILTSGVMANGIQAQSIGGGGGNGGFSVGGALSLKDKADSTVGAGMGGAAGDAGVVNVTNNSQIITQGANAFGVLAQSIGGGGGSGGFAVGAALSNGGDVSSKVAGGAGGGAGAGNKVTVNNTGLILTKGANSVGVFAQSVGGSGGVGAFSIGAGLSTASAVNQSVGGSGGGGGQGGVVTVTNSGAIITTGPLSYGVYAQSVGGGGGIGGFSVAGTLNTGSGGTTSSVGGSGAAGGAGGTVKVTNTGLIQVQGAGSVGVFAQSVGGGGGAGGFSGALGLGGGDLGQTVGGSGGAGGAGGNVTVTSTGSILTSGQDSVAVLAQSVGGGGGQGAFYIGAATGSLSASNLALGSSGNGAGGTMGTVVINVSGGVTQTSGDLSFGLLAQSIGAGGGNSALTALDPLAIGANGSMSLTVGAAGGASGDGNAIPSGANSNPTVTTGEGALGVVVQSIGGGGGTEGQTGNVVIGAGASLSTLVGGSSSQGGAGAAVGFTNSGAVHTGGDSAIGLMVQSIGGGGGWGAFALGEVTGTPGSIALTAGGSEGAYNNGGAVNLNSQAAIFTSGAQAAGLVGQSIGGGGGVTGVDVASGLSVGGPVTARLGATGGMGGDGEGLTIASTAAIQTTGAVAPGLVAQSIGGGGGFAATSGVNNAVVVTLGAGGTAGGLGGAVVVTNASPIMTSGTDSHALVAQSIGGGGGLFLGATSAGGAVSTTVQAANGGTGGAGGTVSVNNTAPIWTTGAGAAGIVAQSIGGGGGLVGGGEFSPLLSSTEGFAGTAGGVGSSGQVKVSTTANILTTGANATAILAQSAGRSGQGDIAVTVASGVTVAGGTGLGHAVAIYGGLRNSLLNAGMLLTQPLLGLEPQNPLLGQSPAQNAILNTGIEEFVIVGGYGDNAVSNTGLVYGNVNLSDFGSSGHFNTFNNGVTGYFAPGVTVILGDPSTGSRLTNAGVLSLGDFYNVLTTNLTGAFTQTSTGTDLTDLNLNPNTADRINVSGSATLSGAVELSYNNPGWAKPGSYNLVIVAAAGGLGGTTFANLESAPSAVFTPTLTYPNATTADLSYTINFSPTGLTGNQHAIGGAINAIQTAGVPAFRQVAAELFFIPTVPLLGKTYDSLSGEGVSGVEQSIFYSRSQYFNATMLNASAAIAADFGPFSVATGGSAPIAASRWRMWMSGNGGTGYDGAQLGVGAAKAGYDNQGYALGLEYVISDRGVIGISGGEGFSTYKVAARQTEGGATGANIGVYGMGRLGHGYYVSGLISYAHYSGVENRYGVGVGLDATHPWTYINQPLVPIPVETATGRFHSDLIGGQFEFGRKYVLSGGDLTPFLNVQFDSQRLGAFDEKAYVMGTTTPGILGLHFETDNVPSVPVSLGVQADKTFALPHGATLTGVARLAWRHEFEPDRPVTEGFQIAPGFDWKVQGAQALQDALQLNGGFQLKFNDFFVLYGNGSAEVGRRGSDGGGTGGFKVRF